MKKTLFALMLTMLTFVAFSQTREVKLKSSIRNAYVDTANNSVAKTQFVKMQEPQDIVSIQTVLTRISGAAAGVVKLLASNDGVNYVRILPTDSLKVTDVATQTKIFVLTNHAYTHYQIEYKGAGTQAVKFASTAVFRKN